MGVGENDTKITVVGHEINELLIHKVIKINSYLYIYIYV